MYDDYFKKNIFRYLKIKDCTIESFATSCGIECSKLIDMMNGTISLNFNDIIKIAEFLNVYFKVVISDLPNFKTLRLKNNSSLNAKEKALQEQILIDFSIRLKDYSDLDEKCHDMNNYLFNNLETKDIKSSVNEVRKLWNLNDNDCIDDIIDLLEKSGIKVFLIPFNLQKIAGFSIKEEGGPAIIINDDSSISLESKIFVLASELGHLILHPDSFNGVIEEENLKEKEEAEIFALELLVSQKAFEEKIKECKDYSLYDTVLLLKKYFSVSYKTILFKLKNTIESKYYNNKNIYNDFEKLAKEKNINLNAVDNCDSFIPAKVEIEPACINFKCNTFYNMVCRAYNDKIIGLPYLAELLQTSIESAIELVKTL